MDTPTSSRCVLFKQLMDKKFTTYKYFNSQHLQYIYILSRHGTSYFQQARHKEYVCYYKHCNDIITNAYVNGIHSACVHIMRSLPIQLLCFKQENHT